jgi:hypothetical protein
MAAPTFNKYRSTTIYGALQVRDFTNSAGTSVIEVASTDLSGNFLSQGDSTFTKKVVCNALLADINANNILTTKEYVDTAVSTGGSVSLSGTNNFTGMNSYNVNFPTSTLVSGTTITDDSIVNKRKNDTLYSSVANQVKDNTANAFTSTNSYNVNFPTSTLPTSTTITTSSIVNKGMNDTLYSTLANQVKTNTANAFTSTNSFNSNFPTSTLPTSTTITTSSIVNKGMNDTLYSSVENQVKTNTDNTFTGQNIYSNNVYCNSILDVRTSQSTPSTFRVAIGDIDNPTLPTASAEQFKQIGELTITQASSTPQTETIDYNTDSSIIQSYNIPANFTKNIICNIPVGIRNTGTCVNSGTASSFTITNLFNSLEVKVYVNSVLMTTLTSANVSILNSNSNTRSSTISYTSTGTKSITLNQYFFNLGIDLTPYLDNDLFVRNNGITNTLILILKANITNTLTKVSNTGNFTATINTALIANTTTSTFSGAFGTNGTATYSPNSNGTNYAIASFNSIYLNLSYINNSGTTYANYLLINKLRVINNVVIDGITDLKETNFSNVIRSSYADVGGVYNQLDHLKIVGTSGLIFEGCGILQTGTAANTLINLNIDDYLIVSGTTTNTMKHLQVDTISTIPVIISSTSQDYSSIKMRNYIFHSRTLTTACGITLSTDGNIDNGQLLYVRKINTGVYTLTITAGTSTTILNLSNASVASISITGLT